ncbi:hypothetical protein OAZ93_02285 [Prochlorococcus sp. AH-736-F09]|nr:hypothetical protein [Prochlorococcus sp. AH-736-F09]
MLNSIKKFIFIFFYNISLFFILLIGIQNSSKKTNVDFLIFKTVSLPISFTIGVGFISGSIIGNLLTLNLYDENNR